MFPGFKASGFELCLRMALGCFGWPHFWSMCRALRAVGFGAGAGGFMHYRSPIYHHVTSSAPSAI